MATQLGRGRIDVLQRSAPRALVGHLGIAIAASALLVGCPPPSVPDDIYGERLGDVVPYASDEQRDTFERGREVAERQWAQTDGLGPHFNLSSCAGCHERPVTGGGGPRYRNFLLVQSRQPDGVQIPTGISGVQPQYEITEGRFATPDDAAVFAQRNPIPMFGTGLIAEISGETIEANADPDDADGDGISGRVNYDQGFVGRFGRKAQTVSVEGFIRGPLFNHLGITTDPLPDELKARLPVPSAAPGAVGTTAPGLVEMGGEAGDSDDVGRARMHQVAAPDMPLTDEDGVADPEMSPEDLFDLVSFSMLLAPPAPAPATDESLAGHATFEDIGCADCHRSLTSARGTILLYSDLLVHDMGEELSDGIRMGAAEGSEFRTQPLWGVASVGPFLHDGRADTLESAITLHGGEAQASRDAFVALEDSERAEVIAFLESLGGNAQTSLGQLPPQSPVPEVGTYGGPQAALAGAELTRFIRGRAEFDRNVPIDGGLGPNFNGDSCRACHFAPTIGGGGPIDVDVTRQIIHEGDEARAPLGGTMAHRHAIGAERPPIDANSNFFELRQTPPLFGLGLIDRIPPSVIMANADPDDMDGDGVRGRAHVLPDGRLGRLGWKADVPNLAEFSRDAMFNELGTTLPDQAGLSFGGATDDDAVADPEITAEALEALTFFMATLSAPPRTRTDMTLEDRGEPLFEAAGCASCHRSLELDDGTPVLLYSDLLLHDVMPEGMRGVPSGAAGERELRTPPLWGLATSGPYMHDGRAATIEAAVARHDGEAAAAVSAFTALSADERAALLAFLASL